MLFLFFLFVSEFSVSPDEIYATNLATSVKNESITAFLSSYREGPRTITELYILDHQLGKVKNVLDGRININLQTDLILLNDSLILVNRRNNAIYKISFTGDFLERVLLSDVINTDVSLVSACGYNEGIAISYRERDNETDLFLGSLDLSNNRFEIIHATKMGELCHWRQHNKGWLLVNQKNSEISLYNKAFSFERSLLPPQEPYLVVKDENIAKLLKAQGTSPYGLLLHGPFVHDGTLTYYRYAYPTKKPVITLVHIDEHLNLKHSNDTDVILSKIGSKVLYFNRDGDGFLLQ